MFGKPEDPAPEPEDGDDSTLKALVRAGADLTKPTQTTFFLYFPTQARAQSAAAVGAREGYRVELHDPPTADGQWLALLIQDLVPSKETIKARRERFEALCAELDGEFDGWEAAVSS